LQNFIKMLESIGPDDMVCIFKCGELAKNPDALISGSTNTIQGYICPACGKRERRITTWTQCNHPGCERIIQRTDRRPVKFCPDCATERAKDHRRKRSRLNKSGITTMADHDYEMTLDEIGKEIGVSRPLIHYAINGNPLSRRTALKIEKWSDGFVPAVELVGLGNNQKSA